MLWLLSVNADDNGHRPHSIHDTKEDCLRAANDYDYANLRLGVTLSLSTQRDGREEYVYSAWDEYGYIHYAFHVESVPYCRIDADLIDQSR